MTTTPADRSNGYEAVSGEFVAIRSRSSIGISIVRDWAGCLPPGGSVLDLGCGNGVPVAKALIDEGFAVYGVDASPTMIASFRARFPGSPAECSAVEDAQFLRCRFDGAIAWGLMFLLPPDVQRALVHRVALALEPGGRFLFTAPEQACEWPDTLTGRRSVSLGSAAYREALESEGLALVGEAEDEGRNHYYVVNKPASLGSAA
ncbi:class I SAM-dependent methyltransferase [Luteimonas sp. SJ-92]|uniref:Class I SAM-dependent methyltransferase n=1 Tax=Luteimonas salinisoli TaxID=2752307 RepID=A0A853JE04_9GAMM|nr:class I SAM-dependent methyltransferase [Luteimonas salinisoli]NZA26829.1 class I SAM-dependent methyltransferase [Luteimonas salinisoli]